MTTEQYPKVYLYKRIAQAKLFIDNNYANNIDIDNIADEACFSKFHFTRLFIKLYGKAPHKYLTGVRIEKAMQLLQANKPVSEACFSVGFESLTSFSGLFKRLVGISPSQYLAQQQLIKLQIHQTPFKYVPACYVHQHGWAKKAHLEK
jgi:AraC-like DNA-binding protein